jgi:broad specificity phosphatase PhoE
MIHSKMKDTDENGSRPGDNGEIDFGNDEKDVGHGAESSKSVTDEKNNEHIVSAANSSTKEDDNGANEKKVKKKVVEKTVFLVRHAESEENEKMVHLLNAGRSLKSFRVPLRRDAKQGMKFVAGCLAGHYDAPLSEKGRQQCQVMGETLTKKKFLEQHDIQLIIHSPLQRARDTCQAMLGKSSQTSHSSNDSDGDTPLEVYQLDSLQESTPMEQVMGKEKALRPRITEFEAWIAKREETTITVVSVVVVLERSRWSLQ